MNFSNSLIRSALKLSLVGIVALTTAFSSFASDSDRIAQLEKEVQELKLRLMKIEAPQGSKQNTLAASQGWKVQANWRSLKKGMSYDEVRTMLGEPDRIRGGDFTFWYYLNGGRTDFYKDKLDSWIEP